MASSKYATEEERREAKRARQKEYAAKKREKKAESEGREVKTRRKFQTEEERKVAKIEKERKKTDKRREKRQAAGWTPQFIGVDGESFVTGEYLPDGTPKQAYCLLLRHDKPAIFNPEGLDTWSCLNYLTSNAPRKTAFVGYFLNFDFEWILKDIEEEEYKALQHGDTLSLYSDEFRVQWFVGKKLVVYRVKPSAMGLDPGERSLSKHFQMTTFQDVAGFFQSSFVQALQKWGFKKDERLKIITSGKAARGGFQFKDLKEVSDYNAMEMELLEELMIKIYDSFQAAYQTAGLKFSVHSLSWSGPGVFANDFLKQTKWVEEHNPPEALLCAHFSELNKESFGNEAALPYPFSLSYFGGRIELAGVGRFPKIYNYDINSAYPYALSLLPTFKPEDFKLIEDLGPIQEEKVETFLSRRLMGMYGVHFHFPEGWSWYPFPVRQVTGGSPNVYYPRQGYTHIMSPELFAVLDTLSEEEISYISIQYAFVLDGTDGHGDALTRMDAKKLSITARKTLQMADARLECKSASKRVGSEQEKEGDFILAMAEKALKLILNSLYGKTVQQVGSHKYYNDFASAWITSTCRALLWRALAPERATDNVLMSMTDGIYSRVPLSFAHERQTAILGDWEAEEFTYFETFKPGIYRYQDEDGMHYKVRGFLTPAIEDKERLFALIWDSVTIGKVGKFPAKMFLPRNLARKGWKREPYLRQFFQDEKIIESELKAKRTKNIGTGWLIPKGMQHVFFLPKGEFELNDSTGYALDFETSKVIAKKEEQLEAIEAAWDATIGYEEYYEA